MSDTSNVVATRNCSTRDEINIINKELRKLEEETKSQSPQERVALLRELNSVQALTRALPPEILSHIFQHVHHSHNANRRSRIFPRIILTLGHVSSYWRQIAWSTPQLWSSLAIDVFGPNIHNVVPLLQLYLRNVAGLLLSVDLFFIPQLLSADEPRNSIASVLFHETNAAKIWSLRLFGAPLGWARQLNNGNFSSLKRLSLSTILPCQDWGVLDLAEVPCLHDVVLSALFIPIAVNLCWSKITSLELEDIHIDDCVKMLICCRNLIEFHCSAPMDPSIISNMSNHELPDIITLNELEIFHWTHHRDPCCLEALRRLRLPALRDLSWNSAFESQQEELAIFALVSNLPPTLTSLTLVSSQWSDTFLKDVFNKVGSVECLVLLDCSRIIVANVFLSLTQDTDAGDHPMLLSSLKRLVFLDDDTPWIEGELRDNTYPLILRFLQDRFRKGCLEFRLMFEDLSMDLPLEAQEELRRMRREGFKLEIYRKSKKLDWLEAA